MKGGGTEVLRGNRGGGGRQSCFVALERVRARSVVGGFGEKCRDRKGDDSFATRRVRGERRLPIE